MEIFILPYFIQGTHCRGIFFIQRYNAGQLFIQGHSVGHFYSRALFVTWLFLGAQWGHLCRKLCRDEIWSGEDIMAVWTRW